MTAMQEPMLAGWREWVALPTFGITAIEAKLDTGALTSALHARTVERYTERGAPWVRLEIQTRTRRSAPMVITDTEVIDERTVKDSGGHSERRIVVASLLQMGAHEWRIELTIANRAGQSCLMLVGRSAMHGRLLVDPAKTCLLSHAPAAVRRAPPVRRRVSRE